MARPNSVHLTLLLALGCIGCETPHRNFEIEQLDPAFQTGNVVAARGETRTLTGDELGHIAGDEVRFIGDSHIYVDIFDHPLARQGGTAEIQYGHVVRAFYTNETPTYVNRVLNPSAISASGALSSVWIDEAPESFNEFRDVSVRMYDRGACSALTSWRSIADELVPAFDEGVEDALKERNADNFPNVCARPTSQLWQLEPVLRNNEQDDFIFTRSYDLYTCAPPFRIELANLTIRVGVALRAVGGRVAASVSSMRVTADGIADGTAEREFSASISSVLPSQVTSIFESELSQPIPDAISCDQHDANGLGHQRCKGFYSTALANQLGTSADRVRGNIFCGAAGRCSIYPTVHRVNYRPDGLELVLADEPLSEDGTTGEPLYPLLLEESYNDMSLCDRTVPTQLDYSCYQATIFEIPPHNFPANVCGDQLISR